jgi:hypothetical protein
LLGGILGQSEGFLFFFWLSVAILFILMIGKPGVEEGKTDEV